jgi:hypothetical protein
MQEEIWSRSSHSFRIIVVFLAAVLLGTLCGMVVSLEIFRGAALLVALSMLAVLSRLGMLVVWMQQVYPEHPRLCLALVMITALSAFFLRLFA